jgi:hypothetical protein
MKEIIMSKLLTLQKKTILVMMILMVSLFSKDVYGGKWVFYSDLGGKSYYDKDSIKKISDNTVTVWTKTFPSQEWIDLRRNMIIEYDKLLKEQGRKDPFTRRKVKDDKVSYEKTFMEINCETGSYRYLKMITYNKSNEIIWSSEDNKKSTVSEDVRQFEPNTPGYYFYEKVCREGVNSR